MDGLSSAASVIAVIQLTGTVVKICGGYIQEVKDARDDIISLQRTVADLEAILQKLRELLQDPRGIKLFTSSLVNNISDCLACLVAVEKRIDLGRRKRMMKRLGIRALRWPFKRSEVDRIITNLERYKSFFTLSLQVDQTTLLTGVAQNTDRIDLNLGLDKLPVARGAQFDSYMNQHEDECLPGTRAELLCQITEWARLPQAKYIFWLSGKAGTGKSTICRTVAKSFSEAKLLGASFFFKRGEGDRGNATKLFPTVAQQLLIRMPKLRASVLKALGDEPDLAGKSLKEQFDKLLLHPLLSLDSTKGQVPTIVIVIDALDECENEKDIGVILQLLPQLRASTAVRVRIFLTSRDETPIMLGFSEIGNHHENLALHNVPEAATEHDISLFLKDRFAKIRDQRKLSPDWPGDDTVQALVMLSVPLFISAATVCRFLDDSKRDPEVRLTELLEDQAKYATKMEKTYLPILTQLLKDQDDDESEQLLQQFQQIVGVIILLAIPLSVNSLSKLLRTRVGVIRNLLNSFQSVLHIPGNQDMPVRILHLSFRDFLVNTRGKFRVNEQQTHKKITKYCLAVMRDGLKRNICDQSSYGTQRKDVDAQLIQQHLSPVLQYSCRYWAHHLAQCPIPTAELDDALTFLQKHFLHWIEAMSFLGHASEVVGIINLLQSLLHVQRDENHELSEFLHDARRFFLKNQQIVDDVPLQIYYAGLVFAPRMALIRREFAGELPNWIRVFSNVQNTWSAELQTLEGHSAPVRSVAFSYDSWLLATGSDDNTVRLWDAATGVLQQTLEGHSDWVLSVAFSHDSRLLATGSNDNTVRLWDTASGVSQLTLDGHLDTVRSVAFSHDSRLVVTGSYDNTVRLWDVATGALQQILEGHSHWVLSVAFSHDSRLLATGSSDNTVRLWDTFTGSLQRTLEGHSDRVRSVAFSNDSRLLATGSDDNTIKLWDTPGGSLKQTIEGHSDSVRSVAFSHDGRLLATGSDDNTVRLWDAATGVLQQTLEGHSSLVLSVVFSYDSRLLATSSYDKTVRLWDMAAGALKSTSRGCPGSVLSVAFSHSGRLLATGSDDNTVRLWDAATGVLQQSLRGHLDWVLSVNFSRDDQLLATTSRDNTVGLWDVATGALQQTLEGHSDWVLSAAFSRDSRLLATGCRDNTVRLWDTVTGSLRRTLEGHSDWVRSIAFSRDGRLLATGSGDNTVRLWDIARGSLQRTLEGHSDWVRSIAFSHDGRLLATGSGDSTVRLWDMTTGVPQQTLNVKGLVTNLEFAEDGLYLMTNLGYLNTHIPYEDHTSGSPKARTIRFLVEDHWLTLRGEKVLWLPPEYRPGCSAVSGNTLALGHSSERIIIIEFRA